jgi:hypothetical protein
MLLVLLPITVKVEFFSEIGCSASIGGLSDHALGHSDSEHDFYWYSVGLFGRHNFTQKWYGLITAKVRIPFKTRWGLEIETDHISGVVDKDSGRNVIKGRKYISHFK